MGEAQKKQKYIQISADAVGGNLNLHREPEANLTLSQKQLQEGERGGAGVAEKSGALAPQSAKIFPQMHWAALRAAHQMALKKPFSFVMVWLYSQARTYFSKNC